MAEDHPVGGTVRRALGPADWLALAAAPILAVMALLTAVSDLGQLAMLCTQAGWHSLLGGMATMYLLMATFHLAPWFKLVRRFQLAVADYCDLETIAGSNHK